MRFPNRGRVTPAPRMSGEEQTRPGEWHSDQESGRAQYCLTTCRPVSCGSPDLSPVGETAVGFPLYKEESRLRRMGDEADSPSVRALPPRLPGHTHRWRPLPVSRWRGGQVQPSGGPWSNTAGDGQVREPSGLAGPLRSQTRHSPRCDLPGAPRCLRHSSGCKRGAPRRNAVSWLLAWVRATGTPYSPSLPELVLSSPQPTGSHSGGTQRWAGPDNPHIVLPPHPPPLKSPGAPSTFPHRVSAAPLRPQGRQKEGGQGSRCALWRGSLSAGALWGGPARQ